MAAKQLNSCSAVKNICINYVRDGLTEEFHTGIAQIGLEGNNLTPYYLRSCAKPLQASLLIDYGIELTDKEIAFCSGSHAGEECHAEVANGILHKLDLSESYLKCGVHAPLSRTMQDKMLLSNEFPTQIHNNCSGKHLGFLSICKKMGWPLDNYYEINHPLQVEVIKKINQLCEVKENYPVTTDGCGVPIVSMPLKNLVLGFHNLYLNYPKIVNAIMDNPYIYGGENRLDTEIIQNTKNIFAKVGAGGLCVVYNTKEKCGFAVKIDSASMSARRIAVLEIINRLGWGNIAYDNKIKTLSGKIVGEINVSF